MKKIKTLMCSLSLLSLLSGTLVGCGSQIEPPPPPVEKDEFSILLNSDKKVTLEKGKTSDVSFTLQKNGEADDTLEFDFTIEGEEGVISFDKNSKKVNGLKKGKASLVITIKDHKEATAKIDFVVVEYFFSRDIQRGNINFSRESEGLVTILGGQSTLVAKEKSTNFIFKATINLPDNVNIGKAQSFGVGSFINNGDNALWFGTKNTDGINDGRFGIYNRNFLNGWGSPLTDEIIRGYEDINFTSTITFEIVRKGNEYAYTINDAHGKFTDTSNNTEATYPGIYSQEVPMSVTDFSVNYSEEDVANALKSYDSKPIGAIKINEKSKYRLVRGFTYNYTATAYPLYSAQDAKISFEIDKELLTSGQEGTVCTPEGALTISNDATGQLKLIAKAENSKVIDELLITILEEPEEAENDLLKVTGGVVLNEDGSIVFPEEMVNVDGVGNEENYEDREYSALLKAQYSRDFTVSFDVEDYKTTEQFPKLQIALGGNKNNFYVAYKPNGECRIEAFAGGVFEDGKYWKGWFNSNTFENFDPTQKHSFKIKVSADGTYQVYLDDNLLTFNQNGNVATLKRDFETYDSKQNIKIATKGVSAKVSNIKVEDGTQKELPTFWHYSNNSTLIDDKNIDLKLTDYGWNCRDAHSNRVIVTKPLENNFALDYDVEFSDATSDSKLILKLGNYEYHLNNKISASGKLEGYVYKGAWGGPEVDVTNTDPAEMLKAHVRLERFEGRIRLLINNKIVGEFDYAEGSRLEFLAFNERYEDRDVIASVKNITVSPYSKLNVYDMELEGGLSRTLSVGKSEVLTPTFKMNNEIVTPEDVVYENLTPENIEFNETTKEVKAIKSGTAKLNITWTSANKTLELTYDIKDAPTENDLLKVNGGVILNDDGSIVFPEDKMDINGVGDEENYTENAYSANIKTKVKGDFEVEFTVSDYVVKEGVEYPKLMCSLGGSHNQFYIAYKPNGENRIESFTNFQDPDDKVWTHGGWVNSSNFENFDKTQAHTFKISLINGIYHVYQDGIELKTNLNGDDKKMVRMFNDYNNELPIRFSTNGVSCKVSNIKVTPLESKTPFYYLNENNISEVTENSFTLKAINRGWENKDHYFSRINSTKLSSNDATVEFDLVFTKAMADGKLIVDVGGNAVMINNKNGNLSVNINNIEHDWQESPINSTFENVKIKITRTGNTITVFANGEQVCSYDTAQGGNEISFSFFNGVVEDVDALAKVTNLTIL